MKRLIFLIIILISAPAYGASYYVDCSAAAGGDGSLATPWDAIADVNAASFSAGDNVYFKRGCTFREQLTVPSSGSAGSPITFGAYGAGAAPVISGADLITPGTSWAATTGATLSDNFNDNDLTGWTTAGSIVNQNERLEITISGGGNDGAYRSFTEGTEYWAYISINPNDLAIGTDGHEFSIFSLNKAHTLRLKLLITRSSGVLYWRTSYFNDSSSVTSATSSTIVTATAHNAVLHWKASTGAGNNDGIVQIWIDGVSILNVTNVDNDTHTVDYVRVGNWDASASVSGTVIQDNLFIGATPYSPLVWSTAILTEPKIVFFNGTKGTKKTSVPALISAMDWYWSGKVLYVYSASDPDTLYTSSGIEAGQRNQTVLIANKDYVTIDGLTSLGTNSDIFMVGGTSDHITIQNCDIGWGVGSAVAFYDAAGGSNLITRNLLHDMNGSGYNAGPHVGSGSGTETVISYNEIYNNLQYGCFIRGNYYIIEHNSIHDNGSIAVTGSAGQFIAVQILGNLDDEDASQGQHVIIRHNTIYGQKSCGHDGGCILFDQYAQHGEAYYNVCYDVDGYGIGSYGARSITIANNVIYNFALNSCGELFDVPCGAWCGSGLIIDGSGTQVPENNVAKNNIIYNTSATATCVGLDAASYDQAGLEITNNIYYSLNQANWYWWNDAAGGDITTWNALTGIGTDMNADPKLRNPAGSDFHLLGNSPAINAGVDVSLTTDYAGLPIIGLPDIGAYEYRGGGNIMKWFLRRLNR